MDFPWLLLRKNRREKKPPQKIPRCFIPRPLAASTRWREILVTALLSFKMIYCWSLRLRQTLSFVGAWWCARSSSGPAIQFGQIVLKHTGTERNLVRAHGRCTWESGKFFRGESAAAWLSTVYATTAFCLVGYVVYLLVLVCLFVYCLRACLHGGGGTRLGEVTSLVEVTRLSIYNLSF